MKRCLSSRRKHSEASIEMAPLIDMVFLLLIFYIVSASFVQEKSVAIERPQSSTAQKSDQPYLALAITKTGSVYINGHKIELNSSQPIEKFLHRSGSKRVLIQADRSVPTGLLLKVMDFCKEAGAETVDVAATAKKG